MSHGTAQRRQAERAGRLAETLSRWLLRLKGYRILARDYRVSVGEIDIIARRGALLAVIEVKRRASQTDALEAVLTRQRRRILRATELFLAQHPRLVHLGVRFDVMLVVPGKRPRHIKDAWRP